MYAFMYVNSPADTAALFKAMKSLCACFSFLLKGRVVEDSVGQPCKAKL